MISRIQEELLPPLPQDLKTALKELRYWQKQVILARAREVKLIEKRELEIRADASVKSLRNENVQLRQQVRNLQFRIERVLGQSS